MKNEDNLKYHYSKLIFENLPEDIRYGVFIAGGAIRDYFSNVEIKDIDLFTDSKQTEDKLLEFLKKEAKLINENDQLANYTYKNRWVQVIKGKFYESPKVLIDSFDFTICMASVYCEKQNDSDVVLTEFGETFFQDTISKHLRINQIPFPLSTLERMQKYIKKGYQACNGTLLSVAKSMQTVDLDNPTENTLLFYPNGGARFHGVD